MWALGYIVMWAACLWVGFTGVMMTFVGSHFQKELGWIGIVMMILSITGGYKLMTCINITVAVA